MQLYDYTCALWKIAIIERGSHRRGGFDSFAAAWAVGGVQFAALQALHRLDQVVCVAHLHILQRPLHLLRRAAPQNSPITPRTAPEHVQPATGRNNNTRTSRARATTGRQMNHLVEAMCTAQLRQSCRRHLSAACNDCGRGGDPPASGGCHRRRVPSTCPIPQSMTGASRNIAGDLSRSADHCTLGTLMVP